MTTLKEMKSFLCEHGYTMEQAIDGYYYCQRHNEDGTTTTIWMDSACEDAYVLDSAIAVAYDFAKEDEEKIHTYTFIGQVEASETRIEIETSYYASEEQAAKQAEYWLGNYDGPILESVDYYVGNDYIGSAEL